MAEKKLKDAAAWTAKKAKDAKDLAAKKAKEAAYWAAKKAKDAKDAVCAAAVKKHKELQDAARRKNDKELKAAAAAAAKASAVEFEDKYTPFMLTCPRNEADPSP